MKPRYFDSGLLAVFRLFIGTRLLLALLTLLAQGLGAYRPYFRDGALDGWVGLAETSFLLVYLSWPWLAQRLGRFYLPFAMVVATLGPLGLNWVESVANGLQSELGQARLLMGHWQIVITLLIPLILVSWQYGFKVVTAYCLAIAALDFAVIVLLARSSSSLPFWITLSIILFRTLFYLLIGYAIALLAAEQRQQNTRLEQANRNLAGYAMTLEQLAISRERNHLARELHDTLAHTLSGLVVQLEAVEALWETSSTQSHQMLGDARANTRLGLKEARRAIQSLRAAPLEDLGLRLALCSLARSEAERGGLKLALEVVEALPGLSPAVEHNLYRVAEEALRNTVRHARASNLLVRLEQDGSRVGLTVEDNGIGFELDRPLADECYGLRGMRERAEAIGGQLEIGSQAGRGSRVQLWVNI